MECCEYVERNLFLSSTSWFVYRNKKTNFTEINWQLAAYQRRIPIYRELVR